MLEGMEFKFSHIFREVKVPTNILSDYALSFNGFHWWDDVIANISKAVNKDRVGVVKYRLC